jgi:hypothetical protein
VQNRDQSMGGPVSDLVDRRHSPRFKLEVEIRVLSKSCGMVKGTTADISESGVSALLRADIPIGELVELDFVLPFGRVGIYATAKQRTAFRYGFQFAESSSVEAVIRPTCRVLAVEQYVSGGI